MSYLVRNGHKLNDVLHEYTVDQVMLLYEKALVAARRRMQEDAITFAHCVPLALGGKDAVNAFKKFVESLDVKPARKQKKSVSGEELKQAFGFMSQFGVSIPDNKPGNSKP